MCLHFCRPLPPRLWNVWLGLSRRLTPDLVLYVPLLSLTEPRANSPIDAISAAISRILDSIFSAFASSISLPITPPYQIGRAHV